MKSKLILIALIILGVGVLNHYYPIKHQFQVVSEAFRAMGPWAIIPYVAVFVLCSIFFIPITGMIVMAGALYGFLGGYALSAFSAILSIAITYALGRKLLRKRVADLRLGHPRFEAVLEAVSSRGPMLVFLIRLNPFLPFSLLNYLFTIPRMDARKYLLASFLAITPDICFYLYAGKVGQGMMEDSSRVSAWSWVILGLALSTTVAAGIIINRVIHKHQARPSAPSADT